METIGIPSDRKWLNTLLFSQPGVQIPVQKIDHVMMVIIIYIFLLKPYCVSGTMPSVLGFISE